MQPVTTISSNDDVSIYQIINHDQGKQLDTNE